MAILHSVIDLILVVMIMLTFKEQKGIKDFVGISE